MSDMVKFSIPDMNCGHCKAAVEGAIGAVDADAKVEVDLEKRIAAVSSRADSAAMIAALAAAGYPAELTS